MHWTSNSVCLLFVLLCSLDRRFYQAEGARANKHVPFLQEEMQLRQRQRHRPRTFFQDSSSRQRQADRLISPHSPQGKYGRKNLLDYVKYEAGGDGLNVTWAHNVNSGQALGRALSDFNGPSTIVEGDVFLKRQSGYTPMMLIPPSANDALKFKDWLANVSRADKTIKINLKTTEAIKPALQYLFTVKDGFRGPLILHSNIGIMPGSLETPVDAGVFTTEMQNAMPEATIGVGWADGIMPMPDDDSVPVLTKYTWRIIFNMLEYTYELRQPVLFSCRALYATYSVYELLWLLSIRDNYAVNVFGAEKEAINDWAGVVALRLYGPVDRIIYDFTPPQKMGFMESIERMQEVDLNPSLFDQSSWRVVQFINPTALLSTIVVGSRGAAFLGWPTAFLLSHVHAKFGRTQTVAGRLLFVRKDSFERTFAAEECGLAIFLLDSVDDMPSPMIKGGVRAFVGSSGRVSLQNRQERRSWHRHRHKHRNESESKSESDTDGGAPYAYISPSRSDGPLTASRLPPHECYGFRLSDEQRRIRLTVFVTRCSGGVQPFPKTTWSRTITLNVPKPETGRSRYVVVQKTGDASIDVFVENLYHKNCADGAETTANFWRRFLPILVSAFLAKSRLLMHR